MNRLLQGDVGSGKTIVALLAMLLAIDKAGSYRRALFLGWWAGVVETGGGFYWLIDVMRRFADFPWIGAVAVFLLFCAARAGDGKVTIWGTGTPRREFLHVDDCADALVYLLRHYSDASTINIGVGRDVTIAELASVVAGVVGFTGQIGFDTSRPDGTPRKLLDVSRLTMLGWQAHTGFKEGIESTYQWLDQELTHGRRPRGYDEKAEQAV